MATTSILDSMIQTAAPAAEPEANPESKALATFEHFRTFSLLVQAAENAQTSIADLPRKGTAREASDNLRQIIRNAKAIEQYATKLLAANLV